MAPAHIYLASALQSGAARCLLNAFGLAKAIIGLAYCRSIKFTDRFPSVGFIGAPASVIDLELGGGFLSKTRLVFQEQDCLRAGRGFCGLLGRQQGFYTGTIANTIYLAGFASKLRQLSLVTSTFGFSNPSRLSLLRLAIVALPAHPPGFFYLAMQSIWLSSLQAGLVCRSVYSHFNPNYHKARNFTSAQFSSRLNDSCSSIGTKLSRSSLDRHQSPVQDRLRIIHMIESRETTAPLFPTIVTSTRCYTFIWPAYSVIANPNLITRLDIVLTVGACASLYLSAPATPAALDEINVVHTYNVGPV
ncbi:hypothetical protein GALMADRAFT_159501 [Galerina marginata CBS 339.88]|uniref:Uncharacterized protein n=1 Tax=Galerina marginata (strain CBS 339.88) TaxID=685588 RepID=A0A067SWY5_GALM3|nr:hypothetical protein GALMADRAFT_159501 [Galerina marginata CBS 339.88]